MITANQQSTSRGRIVRALRAAAGTLTVAVAVYFLVSRLVRDWQQIPFHDLHFSLPLLLLSFAVLVIGRFPLESFAWTRILSAFGSRLGFVPALAVLSVTQIGKYIPGKVWFTLGRASLARDLGVPETKTLASVVVEILLSLLGAVMLLALTLLLLPRGSVPDSSYLLLIAAPVCLALLHPWLFNRLLRLPLRLLRQPAFSIDVPYVGMLALALLYLADWLIQGLGCFILINSFYPLPLGKLPVLLGGYAISWMLGFLVLVAPAGLGVREGIYTIILRTVMPEPVAIISALITRVWMTVSELVMAGVCLPVVLRRRKNAPQA